MKLCRCCRKPSTSIPITSMPMCNWAARYHATKNFKEARSALEEAIQINPFNPLIYRLLGDTYTALGEQEKARLAKATLDKLMTGNN